MRTRSLALVFVVVCAVSAGMLHGCGGSSGATATPHCVMASDCKGALICALGYCVSQCATDKDCDNGKELCITSNSGNVCRPPEVATKMCVLNSDCASPLVCGRDLTCRQQCATDVDCPGGGTSGGQVCTKSLTTARSAAGAVDIGTSGG